MLEDTTLCVITRDDMVNPLGGIDNFLKLSVPYVAKIRIIDTKSTDGTYEFLKSVTYPNLVIDQCEFKDFAYCRNYSMQDVDTKRVLIMDTDEMLNPAEYDILNTFNKAYKDQQFFSFGFEYIFPWEKRHGGGLNPRFFTVDDKVKYSVEGGYNEYLCFGDRVVEEMERPYRQTGLRIKHYSPSTFGVYVKKVCWYMMTVAKGKANALSPIQLKWSNFWKKPSPRRLKGLTSALEPRGFTL